MKYVFCGDSITDADRLWGPDPLGCGYVRILKDRLCGTDQDAEIVNRGHNGFTAADVLRHWVRDCLEQKPDVLTLLVGVNDVYSHIYGGGYGAEDYADLLEGLIGTAKKATDARIILMEPFLFPQPEEFIGWYPVLDAFRNKVRQASARFETGFVPLWDVFLAAQEKNPVRELTTDGIHLTPLGHRILAEAWLKEFLQSV